MKTLKEISRRTTVRVGDLERLNGKLMHATIGIPNGRGLISPIIATLTVHSKNKNYKEKTI